MATEIDGVLKEWGDRMSVIRTRARPAPRNIGGGKSRVTVKAKSGNAAGIARAALVRAAKRVPEVMVKITAGRKDPATGKRNTPCKDMGAIKAHMDYISRNGAVELEDEQGNVIAGREAVRDLRDDWQHSGGHSIPSADGYRREAYSIVLSMPPGTDRESVKNAAREFAAETFDRHQYVFAAHDDEKHPHVHLCVKAVSRDMVRMNPRKADLQEWREAFAERLRQNGIEANATPRIVRGQMQRSERQEERQIVRRGAESKARAGRQADVASELAGRGRGDSTRGEQDRRMAERKKRQLEAYAKVTHVLAGSADAEDRRLAVQVVGMVKEMPAAVTAHRQAVDLGKGRAGVGQATVERGPTTERAPQTQRKPGNRQDRE